MTLSSLTSRLREERGQSLVELALVLPMVTLLIFGILELSNAFNYSATLNNAAANGARLAAVNRNPGPDATLNAYIQGKGPKDGTGVTVCITSSAGVTPKVGDPITVVTSYTYSFLPVTGLAAKTLKGRATMRLEATPTSGVMTIAASC